jgi:hypothetical protein
VGAKGHYFVEWINVESSPEIHRNASGTLLKTVQNTKSCMVSRDIPSTLRMLKSNPLHKQEWPRTPATNSKSFNSSWISLHKRTNKLTPERREFISIQLLKQDV